MFLMKIKCCINGSNSIIMSRNIDARQGYAFNVRKVME